MGRAFVQKPFLICYFPKFESETIVHDELKFTPLYIIRLVVKLKVQPNFPQSVKVEMKHGFRSCFQCKSNLGKEAWIPFSLSLL